MSNNNRVLHENSLNGVGWNPDKEKAFNSVVDINSNLKISDSFEFSDVQIYNVNHPVSLREAKKLARSKGAPSSNDSGNEIFAIPLYHNAHSQLIEGEVYVEQGDAPVDMYTLCGDAIVRLLSSGGHEINFDNTYLGHYVIDSFNPINPVFNNEIKTYDAPDSPNNTQFAIKNLATNELLPKTYDNYISAVSVTAELMEYSSQDKNKGSYAVIALGSLQSTHSIVLDAASYNFRAYLYDLSLAPNAWYFFTV